MAVFPTGHCTARISMSHRPSPSTARSTSPATTSPTAGWHSGWDHVTGNNVTNSPMAFELDHVTGNNVTHTHRTHGLAFAFLLLLLSPLPPPPTPSLSHTRKNKQKQLRRGMIRQAPPHPHPTNNPCTRGVKNHHHHLHHSRDRADVPG